MSITNQRIVMPDSFPLLHLSLPLSLLSPLLPPSLTLIFSHAPFSQPTAFFDAHVHQNTCPRSLRGSKRKNCRRPVKDFDWYERAPTIVLRPATLFARTFTPCRTNKQAQTAPLSHLVYYQNHNNNYYYTTTTAWCHRKFKTRTK